MALLSEALAAVAPKAAAAPSKTAGATKQPGPANTLPRGTVLNGKANMYLQTIDGEVVIRMGEVFSLKGKVPKVDLDNGYNMSKVRSKRTHIGVANVTVTTI